MPRAAAAFTCFLLLSLLIATSINAGVRASEDEESTVETGDSVTTDEQVPPAPVRYSTPDLEQENLSFKLYEHFDDELLFNRRWVRSKATKSDSQDFQYDGEWALLPSHDRVPGWSLPPSLFVAVC